MFLLEGCFLWPLIPEVIPSFTPNLDWVVSVSGNAMAISNDGTRIFLHGNTTVSGSLYTTTEYYNDQGKRTYYDAFNENLGIVRDVIGAPEGGVQNILSDIPINGSRNYVSYYGYTTNPYTKYNTAWGKPAIEPYPWSYGTTDLGPSIARAKPYFYVSSAVGGGTYQNYAYWLVGSFTDAFQPDYSGEGKKFSCPTYGKADCFVIRGGYGGLPVRSQWGGQENDLAYDVASDNTGNATIFLRAGSDFGITSATQSLVRMKTGYNIVRLDTNGLLTETFPVSLGATGELTDTQIALGKNGAVYILAKDEQRQQYFLAKVSSSGTAWTRYFPASVSDDNKTIPGNRSARMGLTVDSKDCAYITGNFSGTVDLGGASLSSTDVQVFVAKYSPTNTCLGALAMGSGLGVTVRLSPDEKALYVNGWADGSIMGTYIPDQNDVRNGIYRPGAFLVKLKMVK
jgi:hypothetical protein